MASLPSVFQIFLLAGVSWVPSITRQLALVRMRITVFRASASSSLTWGGCGVKVGCGQSLLDLG
jgi:hypothetical protein